MICHTYTMGRAEFEERLAGILTHVAGTGGQFVTPRAARQIYDTARRPPDGTNLAKRGSSGRQNSSPFQ